MWCKQSRKVSRRGRKVFVKLDIMRYITVGLFFLFLSSLPGFSQDLILKSGDQVVNNDSIYFSGTKSTELIEIRLSITNNRETAVSLKLKKTEIQVVEGAENSFCWGECYIPAVFVSPMLITIEPKTTDRTSFIGDYRPFEMEGTSIVRYTFFDPADTAYQQSVTVFYQIGGSGLNQNGAFRQIVRVFPNPADQFLRISLSEEVPVAPIAVIVDVEGHSVTSENIPAGCREITWPVAELPSGLYFLRISIEGRSPTTHKICIRH